jgi:mitochondrial chaperone BCS1
MMLLQEITVHQKEEVYHITQMVVPDQGRQWIVYKEKVHRPLDMVYLPDVTKTSLLTDIQEYLSWATKQCYTAREIPYRRGCLLHGRPGTGKSSLALALAGHFHLEVYSVSLLDPYLNDSTLSTSFRDIPRDGCLVLLEAVDSCGIGRSIDEGSAMEDEGATKDKKASKTSAVTLSGLLNAIDGPSAPKGHILFMTTKDPELLDPALVRAGRVDVWVESKYADKHQLRQIFLAMYKNRVDLASASVADQGIDDVQPKA